MEPICLVSPADGSDEHRGVKGISLRLFWDIKQKYDMRQEPPMSKKVPGTYFPGIIFNRVMGPFYQAWLATGDKNVEVCLVINAQNGLQRKAGS